MSHAYKTMLLQLTWPLLKQMIVIPKTCFSYSITSRCAVNTVCKLVKRRKKRKPRPADWHILSWEERLAESVTLLWRMSYEEQLQWKQEQQNNILLEMTKHDGYREVDGNPKTVGFYIGNGKTGNIVCVHCDHLLNMPSKHKVFVLGFKFRISADSFLQVNRGAVEALYKTLSELNRAPVGGPMLDVCCGTGAIGISLSPQMERVIGIELIEQEGWPTLSSCQSLEEPSSHKKPCLYIMLVHSSSDYKRKITGEAFTKTVAIPVYLFPHTPHCELVLVFKR
uniref:Uncharacterized protein n=1 Tax=Cyprinus carpio TaxID=7962 RepID=A0A8C1II69_CYPCA